MVTKAPDSEVNGRTTAAIQRRYERQAAIYDLVEAPVELLFHRWRRRFWGLVPADSRVLEIGVGTGKNLRWHPPHVSVTAVDFSPRMLARATRRTQRPDARPGFAMMDAQALAFAEASFDVAVATFVFCSVPDPVLGLQEARRALKPNGRLLLLEHVRSGLPIVGRGMDLLNPLTVRLQGVNVNRDTVDNVRRAGFRILEIDDLFLDIVKLIVAEPAS